MPREPVSRSSTRSFSPSLAKKTIQSDSRPFSPASRMTKRCEFLGAVCPSRCPSGQSQRASTGTRSPQPWKSGFGAIDCRSRKADPHILSGLPIQLSLTIDNTRTSDPEGRVLIMRPLANDNFADIIKKALTTKLPKLTATLADRRILLLELDGTPRHPGKVAEAIQSLTTGTPALADVHEIWCAQTLSLETDGSVDFYRVWPPSAGEWPHFHAPALAEDPQSATEDSPWRIVKFIALVPAFWFVAVFAIGLASGQLSIPDNAHWDWIVRIGAVVLAVPACWLAVGAKAQVAATFTALIAALYASLSTLLYCVAVIVGAAAFVMALLKGAAWVYGTICIPSIRLGAITLWMVVPVALFICIFKRARVAGFALVFLSSVVFGFSVWMYSLYVAATISRGWMIVGILRFGLGVIPVAVIGSCFERAWPVAGFIIVGAIIAGVLRYGGLLGIDKALNPSAIHGDSA